MTTEAPGMPQRTLNDDLPAVGTPARELTLAEALAIAQLRADGTKTVEYVRRARQQAAVPPEVRDDE